MVSNFLIPGPIVRANVEQVQQIIFNLVINAWEALENRQGSLRVGVSIVRNEEISDGHRFPIGWQPQANIYACIEVEDDGIGIADNDMDKLFDPFFTSKFTGRGLGLSLVLGMLRVYDGCVTVQSQPNQETIFRVYIPSE